MQDFSTKINEGSGAIERGKNLLLRIQSRPLAERRALFFSTFVISSAVVFSLWVGQMYRQFGIVFFGRNAAPLAANIAPQDSSATAENSGETKPAGGLENPFSVAVDNFGVLKQGFVNLFSGISSSLEAAKTDNAALETQGTAKEPPVLSPDSQDKSGNSVPSGEKGVVPAVPSPIIPSAVSPSAEKKSSLVTPPQAALTQNSQGKELPLVINPSENKNNVSSALHETQNSGDNVVENKPVAVAEEIETPQPEKKQSRFVSVIMNNLALIQESFRDLYRYLTQ